MIQTIEKHYNANAVAVTKKNAKFEKQRWQI